MKKHGHTTDSYFSCLEEKTEQSKGKNDTSSDQDVQHRAPLPKAILLQERQISNSAKSSIILCAHGTASGELLALLLQQGTWEAAAEGGDQLPRVTQKFPGWEVTTGLRGGDMI